jgi:hypothetical protein
MVISTEGEDEAECTGVHAGGFGVPCLLSPPDEKRTRPVKSPRRWVKFDIMPRSVLTGFSSASWAVDQMSTRPLLPALASAGTRITAAALRVDEASLIPHPR